MNRVKRFECRSLHTLEYQINLFAENHEIIGVSFCTETRGYSVCYNALVLYKEK